MYCANRGGPVKEYLNKDLIKKVIDCVARALAKTEGGYMGGNQMDCVVDKCTELNREEYGNFERDVMEALGQIKC